VAIDQPVICAISAEAELLVIKQQLLVIFEDKQQVCIFYNNLCLIVQVQITPSERELTIKH